MICDLSVYIYIYRSIHTCAHIVMNCISLTHIISYHIRSYHIISYHILSYHILTLKMIAFVWAQDQYPLSLQPQCLTFCVAQDQFVD